MVIKIKKSKDVFFTFEPSDVSKVKKIAKHLGAVVQRPRRFIDETHEEHGFTGFCG
jgi:hypothetical protein